MCIQVWITFFHKSWYFFVGSCLPTIVDILVRNFDSIRSRFCCCVFTTIQITFKFEETFFSLEKKWGNAANSTAQSWGRDEWRFRLPRGWWSPGRLLLSRIKIILFNFSRFNFNLSIWLTKRYELQSCGSMLFH